MLNFNIQPQNKSRINDIYNTTNHMKSSSSSSTFSYFLTYSTMILFFLSSSYCLLFIVPAPPNKSSAFYCLVTDWDFDSLPSPWVFFNLSYFSFCFLCLSSSAFLYFLMTFSLAWTSCKFFHSRFLYMYKVSS